MDPVRMVDCVKLGRRLPGLADPPTGGALGQRIFENVSADAWNMWEEQSKLVINHYQLVLADPEARAFLREQMEEFFFGEDAQVPEGYTPPGSKGAPAAPAKK
ncbi:MAG: oxidative damage protection protein [Chloroflexota bacterium]|nr:oxidative damage protection protein [Chloroflexota bacterium]